MFKRFIFIGVFIMATIVSPNFLSATVDNSCSLCQKTILKNQKIFENEHVYVLYDYKPIIRGHCLVIPKRHVEHFQNLTAEELLDAHAAIGTLFEAAQKAYDASSYILLQKNGKAAGQSVPHVHFHFFPRKEGDFSDLGLLVRFYLTSFKGPLSQEQIDNERNLISLNVPEVLLTKAQ